MSHLSVPATTRTVEISQLQDLNQRLQRETRQISARDLGLADVSLLSGGLRSTLPANASLNRLCWQGPPEFPYIHGHFSTAVHKDGALLAEMHTETLKTLCMALNLRQQWGA
jgi:hypothetical protein